MLHSSYRRTPPVPWYHLLHLAFIVLIAKQTLTPSFDPIHLALRKRQNCTQLTCLGLGFYSKPQGIGLNACLSLFVLLRDWTYRAMISWNPTGDFSFDAACWQLSSHFTFLTSRWPKRPFEFSTAWKSSTNLSQGVKQRTNIGNRIRFFVVALEAIWFCPALWESFCCSFRLHSRLVSLAF